MTGEQPHQPNYGPGWDVLPPDLQELYLQGVQIEKARFLLGMGALVGATGGLELSTADLEQMAADKLDGRHLSEVRSLADEVEGLLRSLGVEPYGAKAQEAAPVFSLVTAPSLPQEAAPAPAEEPSQPEGQPAAEATPEQQPEDASPAGDADEPSAEELDQIEKAAADESGEPSDDEQGESGDEPSGEESEESDETGESSADEPDEPGDPEEVADAHDEEDDKEQPNEAILPPLNVESIVVGRVHSVLKTMYGADRTGAIEVLEAVNGAQLVDAILEGYVDQVLQSGDKRGRPVEQALRIKAFLEGLSNEQVAVRHRTTGNTVQTGRSNFLRTLRENFDLPPLTGSEDSPSDHDGDQGQDGNAAGEHGSAPEKTDQHLVLSETISQFADKTGMDPNLERALRNMFTESRPSSGVPNPQELQALAFLKGRYTNAMLFHDLSLPSLQKQVIEKATGNGLHNQRPQSVSAIRSELAEQLEDSGVTVAEVLTEAIAKLTSKVEDERREDD